eukprot:gnl/MRDRNA2_/MRDRNA2_124358_c0_seq1.p1 gnl/MRDRNA2_/MRDRNA2_124358_c0~~gnl/MRDRNA2_/MRDRNA2_124358_c0_seq1.p1  ORF type:complete len:160 (-),score=35.80 gnl/MRDRNA2_/MRDRNA2_124358_c0_seq1:81-560(-)
MGSSQSIVNDTNQSVEVWSQLVSGKCPNDGCMDKTMQPDSKLEMHVTSGDQVCVKYQAASNAVLKEYKEAGEKSPEMQTACQDIISSRTGQRVTYKVGEIIGKQSPEPYIDEYLIAALLAFIFCITLITIKSSWRSSKELKKKLLEDSAGGDDPKSLGA